METIAHIRTGFSEKFGIPRQSGLVPAAKGRIFFEKQYRNPDAIRGIEEFSHLWLIWGFSANKKKKELSPCKSTAPWRQGKKGSICNQISIQAKWTWSVIGCN